MQLLLKKKKKKIILYAAQNEKNIKLPVTSQTNKLSKHSALMCLKMMDVISAAQLILQLKKKKKERT